jgi:sortase A
MFAFVAYQLWGTGIQTAQSQDRLGHQFQQALESTTTQATTTTTTTTTGPGPGDTVVRTTAPATTEPAKTEPARTTVPTAPSGPPVPNGTAIAQLKIASIGLNRTIVQGVGVADLKKGPGHFPETPLPGQLGNAAIAGHRTTYGHPFYDLDNVKVGDPIEVTTLVGTYVYRVTSTRVVSPKQYADVIPTVDPTKATLTLATCTPAYTARQRLIVFAELVPEQSSQVFAPPAASGATPTSVPDTLPPDTEPAATTSSTGTATGTGTSPTPTTTASVPTTVPGAATDAFAGGWFDDGGAIPHVLIWGALLAAVCCAAFWVGKRVRRLWVSFLVGAIPFLIVVYFFFENVNRLLPSSI